MNTLQYFTIVFQTICIFLMVRSSFCENDYITDTFDKVVLFDNYVRDDVYTDIRTTRSNFECSALCSLNGTCESYFYNRFTMACILLDMKRSVRTGGRQEGGWKYYHLRGCKRGWLSYKDHCYLVVRSQSLPWLDSHERCVLQHAYLAAAETTNEYNFILQAITSSDQNDDYFWLGGNDINNEGTWVWIHSGETFGETQWYPGGYDSTAGYDVDPQPDNFLDQEDCLGIHPVWDYKWNDEGCSSILHYICEKSTVE